MVPSLLPRFFAIFLYSFLVEELRKGGSSAFLPSVVNVQALLGIVSASR
jgi:hypothetical protein